MRKKILAFTAALAMMMPISSMAATLTGTVTWTGHQLYSFTSEDLEYADGTSYSPDLPVLLICLDHGTDAPFDLDQVSYDSGAGAGAIKGGSGTAGIALTHWLFDQFYLTYYKNGTEEQRRAMQYALWEIGNDYNGTAASVNSYAGSSTPGKMETDTTYDPVFRNGAEGPLITAYQALYAAMKTAVPTLPRTYRSTTYTLDFFKSNDEGYQNMVALIEKAPPPVVVPPTVTAVPTLGQWTLILLSGLSAAFAFLKLRRT